MEGYTREEILRLIQEENVQFIRMQFTDLFGQLKNVAITASQIERALDGEIMLDGSSIQGSVRVEESDQYLKPDLNTFAILPWRPQYGKGARMICNVQPGRLSLCRSSPERAEAGTADGRGYGTGPECGAGAGVFPLSH